MNEKDCPDKLKILVSDLITCFINTETARKTLFKQMQTKKLSIPQILEQCQKAVINYEENQLIYDELEYYHQNGKILGKHPIFENEMLVREVNQMSINKAHQAYRNLATYISRERRKHSQARNATTQEKIETKLEHYKTKRKLIAKKLGLDA